MPYSDITTNDPNPVKRYLQRNRFRTAVRLYPEPGRPLTVLDFGGGNGELCVQLATQDCRSKFICYEPAIHMYEEAVHRLAGREGVTLVPSLEAIADESCDLVYSLEVFEHLPEAESEQALNQIFRLLKPGGTAIIGVPNELYFAALYKGLFRVSRRFGEYDARLPNIIRCMIGKPPHDRPVGEISPGRSYYFQHVGFDHRLLREKLDARARVILQAFSPFWFLGGLFSPEIYYLAKKY